MANNDIGAPYLVQYEADSNEESSSRAFISAVTTLTLGILGSSILPLPWAFSRTGILPGLGFSLVVAISNAYTGTLLIRAAGHLNKRTYEGVVGGAFHSSAFRTLAQLSLVSLLFGNLAGDAALLADTGTLTIKDLTQGEAPKWLIGSGRIPMVVLIICFVIPLSLSRRMRSLERAGTAGVGLVIFLAVVVVRAALKAGLPAIKDGELPISKLAPGATAQVPEAISILFFGFYLQPMLLPLLSEMPAGRRGQDILCGSLQLVTCGVAYVVYAVIGIFGAARWGLSTEGDILENQWLTGRSTAFLDVAMTVYLSISMAPMAITMRYLLDSVGNKGEFQEYSWGRDVGYTLGGIFAATGVAIIFPTQAEKLFAVTGATGVCLVSYVLPVAVHLKLYLTRWRHGVVSTDLEAWLLEDAAMLERRPIGPDAADNDLSSGNYLERRESSVLERNTPVRTPPPSYYVSLRGATPESFPRREEEREALRQDLVAAFLPERPGGYAHVRDLRKLPWWGKIVALCWHVLVPIAVLCLGVGTSATALVVSVRRL